jgi:signal transduction histidine kinase
MVTIAASVIACFALGIEAFFPLFIILLVHLLDISIDSSMFYYILTVVLVLSFLIFMPDITVIVITFTLITMILYSRVILSKLAAYSEISEAQKETILELNKKIADVKSLIKTLKHTASVEERNRIAARIHDQVGHGISGSIIMLEASMLIMKDNPEKATASIGKAIKNLREGVDDIRTSLRDERAERYLIGINDITAMLEEFKVSYNKSTILKTAGDIDVISLEIWACIHDNVKECLTNILKHSNASEFLLKIEVFKKIIKVEYKDNGTSMESFEKGLGLEAIEERTINSKGRCFFTNGENGFCVTNIFTY